jgi:RNA polymerase sigma factor (sigma-70 family)
MSPDSFPEEIDPYARALIRKKARRLIRIDGLARDDPEDFEQELTAALLSRLARFDPSRGRRDAFVTLVVEHAAADLARRRSAAQRDGGRPVSLDESLDGPDGPVRRGDAVGRDALDARLGRRPRSDEESAQLAYDVRSVLSDLPEDLRDLATLLSTRSMSEAARELDVPRTTLAASQQRLRRRFASAGLEHYL